MRPIYRFLPYNVSLKMTLASKPLSLEISTINTSSSAFQNLLKYTLNKLSSNGQRSKELFLVDFAKLELKFH